MRTLQNNDLISSDKVETRHFWQLRQDWNARDVQKVFAHDKFCHVLQNTSVVARLEHVEVRHVEVREVVVRVYSGNLQAAVL